MRSDEPQAPAPTTQWPATRWDGRPRQRAAFKTPRSSLLRELYLPDGRLAWPVAQALGISEPVFRGRLKRGWTVTDAALCPVLKWSRFKRVPRRNGPPLRPADPAAQG